MSENKNEAKVEEIAPVREVDVQGDLEAIEGTFAGLAESYVAPETKSKVVNRRRAYLQAQIQEAAIGALVAEGAGELFSRADCDLGLERGLAKVLNDEKAAKWRKALIRKNPDAYRRAEKFLSSVKRAGNAVNAIPELELGHDQKKAFLSWAKSQYRGLMAAAANLASRAKDSESLFLRLGAVKIPAIGAIVAKINQGEGIPDEKLAEIMAFAAAVNEVKQAA